MSESKTALESLNEQIHKLRDELEVQIHLGAAEARDEWEEIEGKLGHFKARFDRVADAAEDTADGLVEAASLAGDEIVRGYQKIRNLLAK